jgi:hypothetical protein
MPKEATPIALGLVFANNLASSRAGITIDADICRVPLIRKQAVIASLMIVHDIVANNVANAPLRILDSRRSSVTLGRHVLKSGFRCRRKSGL